MPSNHHPPPLGAFVEASESTSPSTTFTAFSTTARTCQVRLFADDGRATSTHAMAALGGGYFSTTLEGVGAGASYKFVLDDHELPDPYARFLPQGVHGPAAVCRSTYAWRAQRPARPLSEQVLYEIHVGTFTEEGTYRAAAEKLPELARLGVTTLELMPVAAFPGDRGWGYDGVALYAPFAPYGTPDDLRRFVDDAHALGLGVILDVVYNHFGPSGNYLGAYAPEYFSKDIRTAWGDGPDFAFPAMRSLVLDNVRFWLSEFRFDGLRLDAVHAIEDRSPEHVVRAIVEVARSVDPSVVIIGEDDRNDPASLSELGLTAVWADDFHHQLHTTLTGERDGYYRAYTPGVADLAAAIERGWLYEGAVFEPSGEPRGKPARGLEPPAFVYCIQNHDQIGNRAFGERLADDVSLDAYLLGSMLLLVLPMTPLLFMGQEWAARSPFLYFTDHEEPLGKQVSEGRREEFKAFAAFASAERRDAIPDPQARTTFERSKLRWKERESAPHARVLTLYRELLQIRREDPVLRERRRDGIQAEAAGDVLLVRLRSDRGARLAVFNFGDQPARSSSLPLRAEERRALKRLLSSAEAPGDPDAIGPLTGALYAT